MPGRHIKLTARPTPRRFMVVFLLCKTILLSRCKGHKGPKGLKGRKGQMRVHLITSSPAHPLTRSWLAGHCLKVIPGLRRVRAAVDGGVRVVGEPAVPLAEVVVHSVELLA